MNDDRLRDKVQTDRVSSCKCPTSLTELFMQSLAYLDISSQLSLRLAAQISFISAGIAYTTYIFRGQLQGYISSALQFTF